MTSLFSKFFSATVKSSYRISHCATTGALSMFPNRICWLEKKACPHFRIMFLFEAPAGRSGVRISVEARNLSLHQKGQTVPGAQPADYSMCSGGLLSRGLSDHLHLVSRLRMSGTIPPLPIYAFVACTGTTWTSTFTPLPTNRFNYSMGQLYLPAKSSMWPLPPPITLPTYGWSNWYSPQESSLHSKSTY
jgi:hypothetical protein